MGKRRVTDTGGAVPVAGPKYHIIRYDFVGDPGKQVGSNVSRDVAEQYVREHQASEPVGLEIVRAT